MTEYHMIQRILETCCVQQTIDRLHFWGPAYELSCDHCFYDKVGLTIEGTFEHVYLITLARYKISSVQLVEPNDVLLTFESDMKLKVIGDNGPFESWQLQANREDD